MIETIPGELSLYNKRGQRLGSKGIATRIMIMDTTLNLLKDLPIWQITPSDIASSCNIQQSNFYTYFESVEEIILALAHRAASEMPNHKRDAPPTLEGPAGLAWIEQIVESSIVAWQKYGPVLRVVEMLADDDVPEFRKARQMRYNHWRDILVDSISNAQAAGYLYPNLNIRLAVYQALSLIRITAEHYNLTRSYPMNHREIVTTTAHMTHLLLTGKACLDKPNQTANPPAA